jgi:hypothetical protein
MKWVNRLIVFRRVRQKNGDMHRDRDAAMALKLQRAREVHELQHVNETKRTSDENIVTATTTTTASASPSTSTDTTTSVANNDKNIADASISKDTSTPSTSSIINGKKETRRRDDNDNDNDNDTDQPSRKRAKGTKEESISASSTVAKQGISNEKTDKDTVSPTSSVAVISGDTKTSESHDVSRSISSPAISRAATAVITTPTSSSLTPTSSSVTPSVSLPTSASSSSLLVGHAEEDDLEAQLATARALLEKQSKEKQATVAKLKAVITSDQKRRVAEQQAEREAAARERAEAQKRAAEELNAAMAAAAAAATSSTGTTSGTTSGAALTSGEVTSTVVTFQAMSSPPTSSTSELANLSSSTSLLPPSAAAAAAAGIASSSGGSIQPFDPRVQQMLRRFGNGPDGVAAAVKFMATYTSTSSGGGGGGNTGSRDNRDNRDRDYRRDGRPSIMNDGSTHRDSMSANQLAASNSPTITSSGSGAPLPSAALSSNTNDSSSSSYRPYSSYDRPRMTDGPRARDRDRDRYYHRRGGSGGSDQYETWHSSHVSPPIAPQLSTGASPALQALGSPIIGGNNAASTSSMYPPRSVPLHQLPPPAVIPSSVSGSSSLPSSSPLQSSMGGPSSSPSSSSLPDERYPSYNASISSNSGRYSSLSATSPAPDRSPSADRSPSPSPSPRHQGPPSMSYSNTTDRDRDSSYDARSGGARDARDDRDRSRDRSVCT